MPAARPLTVWLPFATVLLTPVPVTDTDNALAVLHEIVVVPGAVALAGLAPIEPVTLAAAGLTVTVAVRVIGPPLPCAVSVKVWVPAASPVTFWLPLANALESPGPVTETEVAFTVLHEIVVVAGSVPVEGLALIEPVTVAAALTVTVAD